MIRWIATIAAGAVLSAALAWPPPAARAAPQTSQQSASQSAQRSATAVNLIRGGDTASLVAQLPWWRTSAPGPDPGELESPILTACDVWLGFPFATADAQSLTVRLSAAQHASEIELVSNKIRVADPGEINEIDLAAPPPEPPGGGGPWLRGLLALLGVALAGFSTVRYLVA